MYLRAAILFILPSVLFIPTTHVSATNEIRFVFNDGFEASNSIGCSATETLLIDAVFVHPGVNGTRRDLATRSAYCADVCRGYVYGTCRAIGCVGARVLTGNNVDDDDDNNNDRRNLLACTAQIDTMSAQIDAIIPLVSQSCKKFLDSATRRSECFPDVIYGTIDGIRLWAINSTHETAIIEKILPNTQTEICKSMYVNLESINQPCVIGASFHVQGTSSYRNTTALQSPYSLFGSDQGKFLGGYFNSVGVYNVSITPAQDATKTKRFSFKILNC